MLSAIQTLRNRWLLSVTVLSLGAALLAPAPAHAFGQDVCYVIGSPAIVQCIGVEQVCRTSNLSSAGQLACRAAALGYSLSGLTGNNGIIYGRSLVHSDSTYLMAQLIGFTPWQAYQIMMYTEATDSSQYTPFDQNGLQMISDADIASCRSNWGPSMPRYCEAITPVLNGLYKFNDATGGMLLHLHTRFSKNRTAPPQVNGSGSTLLIWICE